ncbi:MAG: hypothetical protein J7K37_02940 [Candidatus Omnitrophica bacterium]|nr:hypothetical protein [Candidatus Omnitrophota bacterium]
MNTDIGKFLKPIYFCDCDNPLIREKALEITQGCQTQGEKAVSLLDK